MTVPDFSGSPRVSGSSGVRGGPGLRRPAPAPAAPGSPGAPRSPAGPGPTGRSRPDGCPGALQTHAAADGGLARIRVPGGRLASARLRALARAAAECGTGVIELTSRANVQVRGLGEESGFAARMAEAGLLPSPSHERVRNILASPLSGCDGRGLLDAGPLVADLDRELCARPELAALPGRFLFAVDDGRGDVAGLGADAGILPLGPDRAAVLVAGTDSGLRVAVSEAVPALLAVAGAFLAELADAPATAWRIGELPGGPGRVAARLRTEATGSAVASAGASAGTPAGASAGTPAQTPTQTPSGTPAETPVRTPAQTPPGTPADAAAPPVTDAGSGEPVVPHPSARGPVGVIEPVHGHGDREGYGHGDREGYGHGDREGYGHGDREGYGHGDREGYGHGDREGYGHGDLGDRVALGVAVPLGRLTSAQAELLAGLAAEVRLTPWRGVVVPGLTRGEAAEAAVRLADAGLVTDPDSPWTGVSACTGRPGCAKSLSDVQADAASVVGLAEENAASRSMRSPRTGTLPVHWAGCERRCGRPAGRVVDVVAIGDGYRVDADGLSLACADIGQTAAAVAAARGET
ncbi:precorrin-3B synthase [Planomonospora sp. ID82291]|uniref:precorrin-3B synthase n=1 Tax=Planomonospora sp. ID82291 TaxID=2738136 RepID=UPI0027DE5399|nr:precorrin-3B synthase [Planomonospora sp. ID82291]